MKRHTAHRFIRATGIALVATLAVSAPATAAPSSQESTVDPQVKVMTHNVMMLPGIAGDYGNSTRAKLTAEASYMRGYDMVVLSEAFDNGPSDTLTAGLSEEYPHQTPVLGRSRSGWDRTSGRYSDTTLEDGGVTVLSKWPILRKEQYVFSQGCGADWFSNKGLVYAELDVRGKKVHVVGTHLQAEDSTCRDAPAVRGSQFRELDTFLDSLDIPANEQVIVAGDLNVIQTSPEYAEMLEATDTVAPTAQEGAPYSWDPTANSLAASRYPGYDPELLDYVLLRRGHQRPESWKNNVLTPTSPPWQAGGKTYTDFSDHYPVAGLV